MLESLKALLRPNQWVKNLFVLAPLIFARKLGDVESAIPSVLAFVSFCLGASASYILNDICDRKADLAHPTKRERPLPSGRLKPGNAAVIAAILAAAAVAAAFSVNARTVAYLAAYLLLNAAYSLGMKRVIILDVMAIAAGFLLRVLAGAAAIRVESSDWLLLCTMMLALFLGFSKRRHELGLLGEEAGAAHRKVLGSYSAQVLDQMIAVVTASALMSYALYTVSPETVEKFHTRGLIFTVPFVLYGILRYLYLVHRREHGGSPAETLITDKPLLLTVLLWIVVSGLIIYLPRAQ